ncbi:CDP-glycerol glycerophosphotransferase family protein [Enterococcus sp. MJM12]|uniref:CDP-glycerol glycerophosphotransferase family protein n=1 Tax=Candidatus Enterococcus myersii TaxID=2815322 RepID=A0ABS3H6V4_9ENTE|nr:CDP-glycerol glycerophosphotransferase family protein [Enterococcus sp. MJM12]MBO0448868.1 CDP-glycerol glycerophosphotransferase family protein [Enterococcus sp. MJM12]
MKLKNIFEKKQNVSLQLSTWFAEDYENENIDDNLIFYESRDGQSAIDSPAAIFEYLIVNPEFKNFKHVWCKTDLLDESSLGALFHLPNVEFVERNTREYVKVLSSAKYLINNATFQSFFIPKKEQICINTWHGTPLKKMGYDIQDGNPAGLQNVVRNFLFSDYLISPNSHTTKMYTESFKLDGIFPGEILEFGYPRIDVTLNTKSENSVQALINAGIKMDTGKQTVLYCPTWKGSSITKPTDSIEQIIAESNLLRAKIGNKYNVLIKVHPYLYKKAIEYSDLTAYMVPDEFDPNFVMAGVDVLLTDYSSIFFDFLVTNKPILFYCWDKDLYSNERGLYFGEEIFPGPVLETMDEVIESFNKLSDISTTYQEKYQRAKELFCPYDDGNVTKSVVEYIFKDNLLENRNVVKCKSEKKKLLFYVGGMNNNGITSSLINLLKNIDYSKYDVTCFSGYPKKKVQIDNILSIPNECRFIYKPGYAILTKEENDYVNKLFASKNLQKITSDSFPWHSFEREAKRIFANLHFDVAIDFSGYSHYWAKYIAASNADKKLCYMHSDMIADRDREVNGIKIHFRPLSLIFTMYAKFDQLITVSPIMEQINADKLKYYVDPEKITNVLNSLDLVKLFDSPLKIIENNSLITKMKINIVPHIKAFKVFDKYDSVDFEIYTFSEADEISTIAYYEDDEKKLSRYKILINDIYFGWCDAGEFDKKYPTVETETDINLYGYIRAKSKAIVWIDLPTHETARKVGDVKNYRYLLVHLNKMITLSDDSIYYQMEINNETIGWVNDSALKITDKSLGLRKMKNRFTNRHKIVSLKDRICETVNEVGFARIVDFPESDNWAEAVQNKELEIVEDKNKIYNYSLKVKNRYGIYYRLWSENELIGYVNEVNLDFVSEFAEISRESFLGKATLLSGNFVIGKLPDNEIETVKDEITVYLVEKIFTTVGIFYKDSEGRFVQEEEIVIDELFGKIDLTKRFVSFPDDKDSYYNIITMGRLSPEKQQDKLIMAFAKALKEIPQLRLYLLGDGPMRKELIDLVDRLKLNDSIFLLGHLNNPFQILKNCQLFTLTSAYEGQPMVLLEAMALQVPVATTRIPATEYVLDSGRKGLLAKDNSIEGIAEMIVLAYKTHIQAAEFDPIVYNQEAMKMFYSKLI